MSKVSSVFLCVMVFIIGLSLGIYFSIDRTSETEQDYTKLTEQIQDIVIKEVQAKQSEKYNVEEVNTEAEPRVSPYAKLVVEKFFKKCEHTTVDVMEVPKELINLTENEIKEKYDKWQVKSFSPREISIYREIDANCSSHFVIKENDGYLAIYSEVTDDLIELKERTAIEVTSLREEDRLALEEGIKIYGKMELSSFMEDFNS